MNGFDRLRIPQGFLTDAQIRIALENEELIVPGSWDANCIRHASYTLRLGTKVEIASASRANLEEARDFAVKDLHAGDHFDLNPGDTAKLYSIEMLRIPDCVLGFTVARGLMFFESLIPENTYVDPGFNGPLYTTVTNLSHRVVRLHQNDPIARLFLYRLSEPVRQAYQQGAARGLKQRLESFRATKFGTQSECSAATSDALIQDLNCLPAGGSQLAELSRRQDRKWVMLVGFSFCWPLLLLLVNLNAWVRDKANFAVRNIGALAITGLFSYLAPKLWMKLKKL
jgi:deoxycytidine triphosphate deaminase